MDAARNGAVNVSSGRALLRPENPTKANYFGDAGYSTGAIGKWHLGANYPYRPQDRGFQESVWYPSSSILPFPLIGGTITLMMFTCITGRKNNSGLLRRCLFQRGEALHSRIWFKRKTFLVLSCHQYSTWSLLAQG